MTFLTPLLALSLEALALSPTLPSASPSPLDTPPVVAASPSVTVDVPEVRALDNGATVWVLQRPSLPLVSVRVLVPGGSATDPADQPGLASLADAMLTHGAGDRDAVAFAEAAEQLALSNGADTDGEWTTLSLDGHAARLEDGLDLLADAMLHPRFDADEVERARAVHLGELAQALDDPASIAARAARSLYHGPSSPLAHASDGTPDGIAAATADALRASWAARSTPARATFVVVGAVDPDTLVASLNAHFGGWDGSAATALPALSTRTRPRGAPAGYLINKPDSTQSVLMVLQPAPAATDPDMPAARMAAVALGGTFTSRLNQLLREEKGYTYGVATRLLPAPRGSVVLTRTAVRQDATGPALADLLRELDGVREGVSADELAEAIAARRTGLVEAMESRSGTADTLAELVCQGRGPDALARELEALGALDAEGTGKVAKRLRRTDGVVVVVGDLSVIAPAVKSAVPGRWETIAPR